jgi:hypothetical protein
VKQPLTDHNPRPTTVRVLKLTLDVHLLEHFGAVQCDGSSPKPPQRFKLKDLPA